MRDRQPGRDYADGTLAVTVMAELVGAAKRDGIVWLQEDGHKVAAVVSPEVAEAGLRALGRAPVTDQR